jgi:hypothetical protein
VGDSVVVDGTEIRNAIGSENVELHSSDNA